MTADAHSYFPPKWVAGRPAGHLQGFTAATPLKPPEGMGQSSHLIFAGFLLAPTRDLASSKSSMPETGGDAGRDVLSLT